MKHQNSDLSKSVGSEILAVTVAIDPSVVLESHSANPSFYNQDMCHACSHCLSKHIPPSILLE